MIKTKQQFINTCEMQRKVIWENEKFCSKFTKAESSCNVPLYDVNNELFYSYMCSSNMFFFCVWVT